MSADAMYSESHVTLMVPDMDAAVQYYTKTLGLGLKSRYGNEYVVIESPGLTIGLHPSPASPSSKTPAMSIGLGVASLEKAMEQLQARGVQFVGAIVEDPPVRIAHFEGPGGVPLYLCEQSEWR
jgi:predicted enzyme related to lactoylglutathione lyase